MNSRSQNSGGGLHGGTRNGWGTGRNRGDESNTSRNGNGQPAAGRSRGLAGRQFHRGVGGERRLPNQSFHENRGQKTNVLSFRKFTELINTPNDDVIAFLDKHSKNFAETIKQDNMPNDLIALITQVIGKKVCGDTSLLEMRNSLIAVVADPKFLEKLQSFTLSLIVSSSTLSGDRNRWGSNAAPNFVLDSSPLCNLNSMCDLYAFVCAKMQNLASDYLSPNILQAQATMHMLISRNQLSEDSHHVQNLQLRLKQLEKELEELKTLREEKESTNEPEKRKHFQRGKLTESDLERLYLLKADDNFAIASIVPSTQEILADEEPFLRPNLVKGKYPSALTYLDVQFRLLREDFVAPLRESIKEWVNNESHYLGRNKKLPPGTIRFYHDVKLKRVECLQEITIYSMQFSMTNLRRVKWDKSKRLLSGSLVLFTSDKFQTIYFATVYRRDERQLAHGIVGVVWEGLRPETYVDVTFLMVECEVYFESYRHTLKALQFMAEPGPPHYDMPILQSYRMAKYIVNMSTEEVPPPFYLRNTNRKMNFSMVLACNEDTINLLSRGSQQNGEKMIPEEVNAWRSGAGDQVVSLTDSRLKELAAKLKPFNAKALNLIEWPTAEDLGMDRPQYLAFQSAITHELSIIQGPPGTGKTYIGLQIIKLFLSNPEIIWGSPEVEVAGMAEEDEPEIEVPVPLGPGLQAESRIWADLRRQLFSVTHQSPILIVCYTNHALDQFLEGIISIMKSLNIETFSNLIRVGGRSKVEALAPYSIREQRDRYRKLRLFNASYAESRSRAAGNLLGLQITRAGLKDVYKGLSQTTGSGIVDFFRLIKVLADENHSNAAMEIRNCIEQTLPSELQVFFMGRRLPAWLGLNIDVFHDSNFNSMQLIQHWFKVVQARNVYKPWLQDGTVDQNGDVENAEQEGELEDFGLKEIMEANRLEEEISMENENLAKRPVITIPYVHLSPCNFKVEYSKLEQEYDDAEKQSNGSRMKEIQCRFYSLQTWEAKWKNQMRFLQELFQGVKEGTIELPEVTQDLLNRAHFTDRKLHPSLSEKWSIYFHVIQQLQKSLLKDIMKVETQIIIAQSKLAEVNNRGDGLILEKAMVVGLTTTGAAKYNTLLRMMKSRIVIVEEAAEVLESHIVTSITEHCEHLILIGDHQQLRPSTTVYKLAKDYNLDVSLFERLINNNLSWHYLKAQHRMRPEICKLLVPAIYTDLENYPNVLEYPKVLGFAKNLFFVTHHEHERADNDSMTKSNEYEARFLTKLCRYIMLQGYQASQITVLVTYIGQMFLVKKLMNDEGRTCHGVRVTVVDNFQGEENDIILLSLVRSNEDNRVGFLKTDNRICVALSRAKHGMFVIGNMDCLLNSKSKTWAKISDEFHDQGSIGNELQLKCQIHEDIISIASPDDFQRKSPEGGCTKPCPGILPNCNHSCRLICHVSDKDHIEYKCQLKCNKPCSKPEKHPCPHSCYETCPPCAELMMRDLPCGHVDYLLCHVDHLTYKCTEIVLKTLPCCHEKELPCHLPVSEYTCKEKVPKTLDCGHVKVLLCPTPVSEVECQVEVEKDLSCGHQGRMLCNFDPEEFTCNTLTDKILPCGHQQKVQCFEDVHSVNCITVLKKMMPECEHEVDVYCFKTSTPIDWICQSQCDTRLDCGHECTLKCHIQDDPDHLNYKCKKQCSRECDWKHPCKTKHKCYEPCDPCKVRVDKTLPCGHLIKLTCFVDLNTYKCKEACQRTLSPTACPLGHACSKRCSEACAPCVTMVDKQVSGCGHSMRVSCGIEPQNSNCSVLVPAMVKSPCGHSVEVPCRIHKTCTPEDCLNYCHQPCGYVLSKEEGGCGHPCQGDCSACFQGRIHVKCQEKCGRVLACGHVCKELCSSLCPPCQEKCILVCKHSKCKKPCGTPCTGCKERCKWSCEHKQCSKKCSDICNREACDEPCKKKLECEHDCIGMCGEPCPPFCRVCDKDVVQEILFGDEDEDNARFVFLQDCGHLVHQGGMDNWMVTEQVKGEVGMKSCPKCKKTIVQSVRYGNVLKRRIKDVLAVRDKIFGNDSTQKSIQARISDQLQVREKSNYTFDYFRQYLEDMTCSYGKTKNKGRFFVERILKKVDQYTFESLHNMVTWWADAEQNVKLKLIQQPREQYPSRNLGTPVPAAKQELTEECHTDLATKYNSMFQLLSKRKLPLSAREIEDFNREFDRLYDLYRLFLRRGVQGFASFRGTELMFNVCKKGLCQPKPYSDDIKKTFEAQLKQLESLIESGWKHEERDRQGANLFQAMGFGSNHWYKCANGHLYTVGNCGQFNQTSRCPECKSNIGTGTAPRFAGAEEQIVQELTSNINEPMPNFTFDEREPSRRGNRNGRYTRGRGAGRRGSNWLLRN